MTVGKYNFVIDAIHGEWSEWVAHAYLNAILIIVRPEQQHKIIIVVIINTSSMRWIVIGWERDRESRGLGTIRRFALVLLASSQCECDRLDPRTECKLFAGELWKWNSRQQKPEETRFVLVVLVGSEWVKWIDYKSVVGYCTFTGNKEFD